MAENNNILSALEGLGASTQPKPPEVIPQEAPKPMMAPMGGPETPAPTPAPPPPPALSPVQEAVIRTTEAEAAKPPELSPLQNLLMAAGVIEDQRPVAPVPETVERPQTFAEAGIPEPLSGPSGETIKEIGTSIIGGAEAFNRQAVNAFSFFFPGIAEKLINKVDPDTGQPMRTLSSDPKDFVMAPKTEVGRFTADIIGQAIAAFFTGGVGTAAAGVRVAGTAGRVIRGAGRAVSTAKATTWQGKVATYMTANGVENLVQDMVDTRPDAVMTIESLLSVGSRDRAIRAIKDVNNTADLQAYVQRKLDVFVTGGVIGSATGATLQAILGGLAKIVTGSILKRAPEIVDKFPNDFNDKSGGLIPVPAGVAQRGDELISEGLEDLVDSRVKMTQPPEPAPKAGGAGGEEPPVPAGPVQELNEWDNWGGDRAERTVDAVINSLGRGEDTGRPEAGSVQRYNEKLFELRTKAAEIAEPKSDERAPQMPFEVVHYETADAISELSSKFDDLMDNLDQVNLPTIRTPDGVEVPITAADFRKAVVIMYQDLLSNLVFKAKSPMGLVKALSRVKMPKFFVENPNELMSGGRSILALHDIFSKALNKFNKRDIAETDRALRGYFDQKTARDALGENPQQQLAEAITGQVDGPEKRVATNLVNMTLAKDAAKNVVEQLNGVDVRNIPDDAIGGIYDNLINIAKTMKILREAGATPFEEGRAPQVAGQLPKEKEIAETSFELYGGNTPEVLNRRLAELVEESERLQGVRARQAQSAGAERALNELGEQVAELRGEAAPEPDIAAQEAARRGVFAQRVLAPYQRRLGDVVIRLARAGVLNNADITYLWRNIYDWQDKLNDNQYGFLLNDLLNAEQRKAIENIQAINEIFLSKAESTDQLPIAADVPSLLARYGRTNFKMYGEEPPIIEPTPSHLSAIEAELQNILSMHEGDIKKPTFEPGGREGGMFKGEAKPVKDIIERENIGSGPFQIRRLMDRFGIGSLKARVLMSQLTVLYSNTVTAIIDQLGAASYGIGAKIFSGKELSDEARLALWRAKQTTGLGAALDLARLRFSKMVNDAETGRKFGAMGEAFRTGKPVVAGQQTAIEQAIGRTQTARGILEQTPEVVEGAPRSERFLTGAPALPSFLGIPEKITSFGPKSMAFIDEFFKQRTLEIEYKAAAISAFLKKHGKAKTFEEAEQFANDEWGKLYNRSVLQTEAELYKRAASNVDNLGKFNKTQDPILYALATEIEYRRILTELNQNVDDVPEWLSSTTRQIREYMDYQASTLNYKDGTAGALMTLARGGGGVAGNVAKTLIMFPQTAVNELVRTTDLMMSIPTLVREQVGNIKQAGSISEWEKMTATTVSPTIRELMHPDIAVRSRARARLIFGALFTGSGVVYGGYKEATRGETVKEALGTEVTYKPGEMPKVEYPGVATGPTAPYSERITEAQRRLNLKPGAVGTFEVPVLSNLAAASQEAGAAFISLFRLIGFARNEMTAADKPGQFSEIGERIVKIADYMGSDDFTTPIKNALQNPQNIPAEIGRGMFSPMLGGTPLIGLMLEMASDHRYDPRTELGYFEGPEDESPLMRTFKIAGDKGRIKRSKEGLKVSSPVTRDFMRSILKYRGRDLLDAFDNPDPKNPEENRAVFDALVASGWAVESIPRLMSDPSYKSPNIGQIDLKKFKMADGRSAFEHVADYVAYGASKPVGTQETNAAELANPKAWIGGPKNKTLIQFMQDEFFAKLPEGWKAGDFDMSITARKDNAQLQRTKQQMDRLNGLLRARYEQALRLVLDKSEAEKAQDPNRLSLKTDFTNIQGASR